MIGFTYMSAINAPGLIFSHLCHLTSTTTLIAICPKLPQGKIIWKQLFPFISDTFFCHALNLLYPNVVELTNYTTFDGNALMSQKPYKFILTAFISLFVTKIQLLFLKLWSFPWDIRYSGVKLFPFIEHREVLQKQWQRFSEIVLFSWQWVDFTVWILCQYYLL